MSGLMQYGLVRGVKDKEFITQQYRVLSRPSLCFYYRAWYSVFEAPPTGYWSGLCSRFVHGHDRMIINIHVT